MRVQLTSRIYTPRVRPKLPAKIPALNDDTAILFQQVNPKPPSSTSYTLYEKYKEVTTVGAARQLGATTGHVGYNINKGLAKVEVAPVVVLFGATGCSLF